MAEMPGTTLLDLSRHYAAGQLDFASYRQQRRSLIRRQLQAMDERTLPVGAERLAVSDTELTLDRTRDFQPTPAVSLAAPSRRGRWALVGGAAALLLIGALAVGVHLSGADADSEPQALPKASSMDQSESPLLAQITELLRHSEFTPAQLSELERAWQAVDSGTRRQLRSDRRYTQLLQQLDSQVLVLEALDPTGADASVTARIARLVEVRERLWAP